jgi:8-amino-7-oxononanoate synthase
MLDDAHGFGVLGEHGRGILEHFNVSSPRIIYMATLGKAAGVFGAFVAGGDALIQTLIQRARTYIYTTAFPPMLATALLASLHLFREEGWRRAHLRELVDHLKTHLTIDRWHLLPSDTPIQPLIIGGNQEAVDVAEGLRAEGILVPAIRPPTVPKGQARLRISLSAAHSKQDVRRLCDALNDFA